MLKPLAVIGVFLAFAFTGELGQAADQNAKTSQTLSTLSVDQQKFASEPAAKTKSQGLRLFMAKQQGKTTATTCNLSGTPPLPTPQQFGQYNEPFGANFDVAATFGDAGANGIPSATNTIQTEALGQIEFESEHFFYDYTQCLDQKPTLSFGGEVGLRPALVMENLSSSATITNPNDRPMFQDAFGWTLGPKLNLATSSQSQLSFFANLGENYLISDVTSFKEGDNTVTATPVSNNVGQSAIFWETGVQWKLLNVDIPTAYINKTDALNPPFTVSVGYKHDSRFNRAGDLSSFSDPEARLFFRFSVGLDKILNWTGNQLTPGKGYTFKFGVDYEKPVGSANMPVATLYYVSANIDLVKVFKPVSNP
jgi:hypothetical protein